MKKNMPSVTQLTTCLNTLNAFTNHSVCAGAVSLTQSLIKGYLKQEINHQIRYINSRVLRLRDKELRLQRQLKNLKSLPDNDLEK